MTPQAAALAALCGGLFIVALIVIVAASVRKRENAVPLVPPPAKKGFQVGDRVVVVRFPNDPPEIADEYDHVYGMIGEIAEVICNRGEASYDYTVRFPGWLGGWSNEETFEDGEHWGVLHKNLRRVVSKRDQR
jgi:hypothetical protein